MLDESQDVSIRLSIGGALQHQILGDRNDRSQRLAAAPTDLYGAVDQGNDIGLDLLLAFEQAVRVIREEAQRLHLG